MDRFQRLFRESHCWSRVQELIRNLNLRRRLIFHLNLLRCRSRCRPPCRVRFQFQHRALRDLHHLPPERGRRQSQFRFRCPALQLRRGQMIRASLPRHAQRLQPMIFQLSLRWKVDLPRSFQPIPHLELPHPDQERRSRH